MKQDSVDKLRYIIQNAKMDEKTRTKLLEAMDNGNYEYVINSLENFNNKTKNSSSKKNDSENASESKNEKVEVEEEEGEQGEGIFPKKLSNIELECDYLGLLLEDPKLITRYYFVYKECFFELDEMVNIYKSILFTEGSAYSSDKAKKSFTLPDVTQQTNELKVKLKRMVNGRKLDMEKVYTELKKLFVLRRNYLEMPIKNIQKQVTQIVDYELYDQMSVEEIENAVNQVTVTEKFKRGILSQGLTDFLKESDNTLTNGLNLPFPIISSAFKGVRKGETMSYAMPSNAGKSRFAINLAAYMAYIHHKKILLISNEMSEEKMKLCLITTIVNNKEIQKLHGQNLRKTEGEILEFKYRPDDPKNVEVDENGFVKKLPEESQKKFVERLSKISTEFNMTIKVTDWINSQTNNSIYFIHITEHTNDELRKIIMNYYYKEKIEYIFYDTLKTDTENIGNSEEIKKTATILSNLAQNFEIFICSSIQLEETDSLPINLTIRDLAVSKTVKEVLDTLCLIKQINNDSIDKYEYSLKEVDTKFFDIEKSNDPDVRYYACVVDKNRAGAKPKVLFKLNLAYNEWEELGYLRIKQKAEKQ